MGVRHDCQADEKLSLHVMKCCDLCEEEVGTVATKQVQHIQTKVTLRKIPHRDKKNKASNMFLIQCNV